MPNQNSQLPDVGFEVDTFHLVLLSRGEKAGELDEDTIDRLGDEHLQHNLRLQADGTLLAAGAVIGAVSTRNVDADQPLVGLGFWNIPREEVLRLKDSDPGVQAGLYKAELVRFVCPKGTITFMPPDIPNAAEPDTPTTGH
jgi:hypothetical protein